MAEGLEHTALVDAWLARLPQTLAAEQVASVFEQSFTALSQRARSTLGDVTVSAIVDRVLHDLVARFPLQAALQVDDSGGVQFGRLRREARPEQVELLREGMRATLVHFLTVVGNLTADILTPALHEVFNRMSVEDPSPRDPPPQTTAGFNRESEGLVR